MRRDTAESSSEEADPGNDAVIPEVKDGSLEGMGLFSNGRLCGSGSGGGCYMQAFTR